MLCFGRFPNLPPFSGRFGIIGLVPRVETLG
jgi:hypothetical protein